MTRFAQYPMRRLILASASLVVLAGCQPSTSTVCGVVTLDGQPVLIPSDGRGTIVFHPVGGQGTLATGILDSTGRFKLATGGSSHVAPGKYQVAVSVAQLLPKTEGAEQGAKLITPTKYASASESGLQADLVPGENQLSFNLVSSASEDTSSSSNATSSSTAPQGSQPPQNSAENN